MMHPSEVPIATSGDDGRERRLYDSSRTRVAPVFNALKASGDPDGVRRLLDLLVDSTGAQHSPRRSQNLEVHDCGWGENEWALDPPVSLLSWLIRNLERPARGTIPGSPSAVNHREKVLARDPSAIADALSALRRSPPGAGWHIFEGPTCPDAYIETRDALIVVEGKRTERGPTTYTQWMSNRHQMLRHLDAAWEIRGARSVYGFFVVEAGTADDGTAVPEFWREAARATVSEEALSSSLPHRGPEDRCGISDSFLGVTTWQAIVKRFALPGSVLPHTVRDIASA